MSCSSARARNPILARLPEILGTAGALAQLDALGSLPAETARLFNYCRPRVGYAEGVVSIRDGRHPVLEQNLSDERFVPNDVELGAEAQIGADHRAEHGGQEHGHPAGGVAGVAGAHGVVCAGGGRRGLIWWTGFSRASARATTWRGGS